MPRRLRATNSLPVAYKLSVRAFRFRQRPFKGGSVSLRPLAEVRQRLVNRLPKRGQPVLDSGGYDREHGALDESVFLEPAQRLRQHLLRYAGQVPAEYTHALRAPRERVDDR